MDVSSAGQQLPGVLLTHTASSCATGVEKNPSGAWAKWGARRDVGK